MRLPDLGFRFWPAVGEGDGQLAGQVYTTATALLCLEIFFRYLPVRRSDLQ